MAEQLQSLQDQTVAKIDIWLSDDGSRDQTLEIAQTFAKNWTKGSFNIVHHTATTRNPPFEKMAIASVDYASENFNSLIQNQEIEADYYALCDQDDIWHPDKLETAEKWLSKQSSDEPAVFCSRTRIIDTQGKQTGMSPLFDRQPNIKNAIIQNIVAGNTAVLNKAAIKILRPIIARTQFVSHDWGIYLAITATGGKVHYSSEAKIDYRQHTNNLIGENSSWQARLVRLKFILSGRFKHWNDKNTVALQTISDQLIPSAHQTIEEFNAIRKAGRINSLWILYKSGIRRQTTLGHISLYIACFLKKI